jgi:GT2 family glycosyltransferase
VPVELSFCVVNTDRRALLRYCLDAIARERATVAFETEVLVLDNGSQDGSIEAARAHPATTALIARKERRGSGENHRDLLEHAQGRHCLFLDEDSELEPGATVALHATLTADPRAGAAGAALVRPDGGYQPSAWRFPGAVSALLSALHLRWGIGDQSRGDRVRRVDWCPSSALLLRRQAVDEVDGFDAKFVGQGDAADLCKRLSDAGWHTLFVPAARAAHHESTSAEFTHDGQLPRSDRELFLRKHHPGLAGIVRLG